MMVTVGSTAERVATEAVATARAKDIVSDDRFTPGCFVIVERSVGELSVGGVATHVCPEGRFIAVEVAEVPKDARYRGSRGRGAQKLKVFVPEVLEPERRFCYRSADVCRTQDGQLVRSGDCSCEKKHFLEVAVTRVVDGPYRGEAPDDERHPYNPLVDGPIGSKYLVCLADVVDQNPALEAAQKKPWPEEGGCQRIAIPPGIWQRVSTKITEV